MSKHISKLVNLTSRNKYLDAFSDVEYFTDMDDVSSRVTEIEEAIEQMLKWPKVTVAVFNPPTIEFLEDGSGGRGTIYKLYYSIVVTKRQRGEK